MATPSPCIKCNLLASINPAVINKAMLIVNLILFSESLATMPAPIMAPPIAVKNITIKVMGSTSITLMNIIA